MSGAVNMNRPARDNLSWDRDQPFFEEMIKRGLPVSAMSEILQRTEGAIIERGRKTFGTVFKDGFLIERPKIDLGKIEAAKHLLDQEHGGGSGSGSGLKDAETLLTELLNEVRVLAKIMEENGAASRKIASLLEDNRKEGTVQTLIGGD